MKPDDAIRDLHGLAELHDGRDEVKHGTTCMEAADLIKAMRDDLMDYPHSQKIIKGQANQNSLLRRQIDRLQAELSQKTQQLAASQRREQAARINPKPLTLDELRERDGKPVWVKEITLEPIDGDYWGIVDVNLVCPGSFGMGAIISPATDGKSKFAITPFSEYDKTHVAYDHPPKEDNPID